MISWLDGLDKTLFHLLNGTLSNALLDVFMPIITNQNYWVFPVLILIFVLILKGGKRGKIAAGILIISVAATDVIAAQIIKPWVGRLRPSHAMAESINLLVAKGGKYSFVSNHAANMFSAAAVLTYFYSKWNKFLYTMAVIVSLSRIYVGVHYPGDVIIGGLFGYGMAWSVISLWILLKMREIKKGRRWVLYE
ncbi:MAG: phosphatase PAP2 family protein [Candidatus Marinimicrobia bacterium]|nr:phosphatase PAP2 family protein [Candidatus Neomarinimicrobiota bacterium]MCH7763606.1 phosphatase PAP2 family protein [Candidatus Neomarinimicrobiota bacterium]